MEAVARGKDVTSPRNERRPKCTQRGGEPSPSRNSTKIGRGRGRRCMLAYLVSLCVLDLAVEVDVPPHGHRHVEHLAHEGRRGGGGGGGLAPHRVRLWRRPPSAGVISSRRGNSRDYGRTYTIFHFPHC